MFCVYNKPTPAFNSSFDLISLFESLATALDQTPDCGEKCLERLEGLARNSGVHSGIVDKSPPLPKKSEVAAEAEKKQPVDSDYFSRLTVTEDDSKYFIKFIDKDISHKTLNVEYFDEDYLTIEVTETVDGYSYKHTSTINFNLPVNSNGIYAHRNKDGRVSIKVPKKSIKVKVEVEQENEQAVENGPGGNQELSQPAIEPLHVEEANSESANFQESNDSENQTIDADTVKEEGSAGIVDNTEGVKQESANSESNDSENQTNQLPQPIESDAAKVEESSAAIVGDASEHGSADEVVVVDAELTMSETDAADAEEGDEPFENISVGDAQDDSHAESAQDDSQAQPPTNPAPPTQTVAVDTSAMQNDVETALEPSSID